MVSNNSDVHEHAIIWYYLRSHIKNQSYLIGFSLQNKLVIKTSFIRVLITNAP